MTAPMRRSPALRALLMVCVLLSCSVSAAPGQGGPARPLEEILGDVEVAYDRAISAVSTGASNPGLASRIDSLKKEVGTLTTPPAAADTVGKLIEARWDTMRSLLGRNLDTLAAVVRMPPFSPQKPGPPSATAAASEDSLLVEAVTKRVQRSLRSDFERLDAEAWKQARFAVVAGLFNAFRLYRERLLALAEEACLERHPLCKRIAPLHAPSYLGATFSGYSGDLYGIGAFASLRGLGVRGRLAQGWRALVGVQILAQLPERREWAGEISFGSVYGDFAVMPGVIISPGRGHAVEMSGSVIYLHRSRVSLGFSYAVEHGWGVRAVYGF